MTTKSVSSLRGVSLGALVLAALTARAGVMKAQTGPSPAVVTLGAVLDSVHARAPQMLAARARTRAARGDRTTAGTFDNPFLMYQVENTPFPGGAPLSGVPVERM